MKFLFVSDLQGRRNSGAAGSLITIGENIEKLGPKVDYLWKTEKRYIKNLNYYRFFELPFIQYFQIKKALRTSHYDAVFISQPHAWYIGRLKKKFPLTLFINRSHGWELRIDPITWKLEPAGLLKKISNQLTLVLLKHSSFYTVKYADSVLCSSSDDANYIKEQYPKSSQKVFSISYGLDSDYLSIPLNLEKKGKLKFLFVGQYLPRKGVKDLQYAFKKLAAKGYEFELSFIVNQHAHADVSGDFNFLPAGSLKILNWMDREGLLEIYSQNDVFLMPSYGEGFGKTTLEAMAAGLCTIGYREGALTDIGLHQKNALLTFVGDKKGLFQILEFALNNPAKVRSLGQQAYLDAQSKTWSKTAASTLSLVKHLINKKQVSVFSSMQLA